LVTGLPGRYAPGANYTLNITVTTTDVPAAANRSQGGFSIEATAGALHVPPGMEGLIELRGLQAAQTKNGSLRRDWQVVWTAPSTPDLAVAFHVFVNTVNGNGSEGLGTDHWTMKTIEVGVGDEPRVTGPPPPRPPFAVETYAVLAFAAAFGAYALYLFRGARRPADPGSPDSRQRPPPRRRGGAP
jgi:hypothetical protein